MLKSIVNGFASIFDPYRRGPLFVRYGIGGLAFLAAGTLLFYLSFTSKTQTIFGPLFNFFTIGVHELGHPLFRMIFMDNHFMTIIGGTAMEIIVPVSAYIYFLRRGEHIQSDFCLILLGIAFKSIGFYTGYNLEANLWLINADETTKPDWEYMHRWFGTADYDYLMRNGFYLLSAFCITLALYLLARHIYNWAKYDKLYDNEH